VVVSGCPRRKKIVPMSFSIDQIVRDAVWLGG
jgi:hypothetical protein